MHHAWVAILRLFKKDSNMQWLITYHALKSKWKQSMIEITAIKQPQDCCNRNA